MDLADDIMLSILAATDALFIPDRDPTDRRRHTVLYERRRDFPDTGVPWKSEKAMPGLDESGRKRVQRALDDLALRGQVETFRPKGFKTLGVRLTSEGEARIRALCGLPGYEAAQAELETLGRLLDDEDWSWQFLYRIWTAESKLTGIRWGDNDQRHKFVELEERMLPALHRRLVDSNCSVHGHCWYSLNFMPARRRMPVEPVNLPCRNDMMRGQYYGRAKHELAELRVAEPHNDREIGQTPMPCSMPPKLYPGTLRPPE